MIRALAAVLLLATSAWADEVRYAVRINVQWEADTGNPDNPHWSRLIAFAHSTRYGLFADGDTASSGLALVATNGRVSILEAELAEARRRGRVGEQLVLPGLSTGVGVFEFELPVTQKLRAISFATMLAPSPDWFSGASGVVLFDGQRWLDDVRVPLWVWDAGADSGPDFEGENLPTQPRQSVRLLAHPAFLRSDALRPIGEAVFERID